MREQRRRRERVEKGIYRRTNAAGKTIFEVGYRDSESRQRWETVEGGITAARRPRAGETARDAADSHPRPWEGASEAAAKLVGESRRSTTGCSTARTPTR